MKAHAAEKSDRSEIERLVRLSRQKDRENERLRAALAECADRFERCCVAMGSDPEHAASSVERYRNLLTK